MIRLVVALVLAAATVVQARQAQTRDLGYYTQRATEAYRAKDYPGFLAASLEAAALVPDHPRLWYNLACAYALTGQSDRAVAWLGRLAAAGLVYPAAEDADFASLSDSAGFRAAVARFAENAAPVHRAEVAFPLPERGLVPEGLAYDPVGRAFYVGCVHKRKIVRIDRRGVASDLVANRDELWAAFGLRVDARRRVLWVTTGAVPQMLGDGPDLDGRSALLRYDLATGRLQKTYAVPGPDEKHAVADLTLGASGDVYLTDSATPAIYVVHAGADRMERLAVDAPFVNLQGVALSTDERRLYVADYARGIFVVDLATMACRKLAHADDVCLYGVDGLCLAGGRLYATQNGVRPKRVVRVTLDATGAGADRLDVLEASTPALGEPTLGAVVDGWFYFNADSQWDRFDDDGRLPADADLRPSTVMRVRL